jgi:hypothetical protein
MCRALKMTEAAAEHPAVTQALALLDANRA